MMPNENETEKLGTRINAELIWPIGMYAWMFGILCTMPYILEIFGLSVIRKKESERESE